MHWTAWDRIPTRMGMSAVEFLIWLLVYLSFYYGDIVLTAIGLAQGFPEANPLSEFMIFLLGLDGMLLWKSIITTGFVTLFVILPDDRRIGIPIGLAIVGIGVVVWNLLVVMGPG